MEIVLHALNRCADHYADDCCRLLFRAQGLVQRGKCGADFASGELCLPAYIYADQYFWGSLSMTSSLRFHMA